MALTTAKNGQEITAPDTAVNTVEFHDDVKKPIGPCTWKIHVTAGTIQFAADTPVVSGHKAWPVDSIVELTVHKTLHYKAASNTDKFVPTV
jgi:hypothetical protein